MKAHLKIFADPGERSDIVRVSFGIVRGMERVSGVNCVYFLEQTRSRSMKNVAVLNSPGAAIKGGSHASLSADVFQRSAPGNIHN